MTPQQPFSTILALSIVKLVREHVLEINTIRTEAKTLTDEELGARVQEIDAKMADAVLDVCRTTLASLETVVDRVLQIEEQMRLLRSA